MSLKYTLDIRESLSHRLPGRLSHQRRRIEHLEALLGAESQTEPNGHDSTPATPPADALAAESLEALQQQGGSWTDMNDATVLSQGPEPEAELPSLRGVQMNVPFSVLSSMDKRKPPPVETSRQDPIKAGLIDMTEAQAMFDV